MESAVMTNLFLFIILVSSPSINSESETRDLEPLVSTSNNISTYTIGNETLSFHPIHDGPYATSQYSITCCRNGTPSPDSSLQAYIHDWSQEMVGIERNNKNCRRFNGYYSVPSWILEEKKLLVVGVRCKCPDEENLDRNCRYLPDCANGGYRSFSINLRCVCPPQWFGDLCEKFCLNGQLYKDFAAGGDGSGIDRCKCNKNFYGEACDEVLCFNGGSPVKGRGCICSPPYVGPHCEEIAGLGSADSPAPSSFHRDLSSSVVSVFLAIALALGVFFLVRRRTRWMRRRAQARRAMMMGNVAEMTARDASVPPTYSRTMNNNEMSSFYDISGLPPPPAYNDIVKVPPPYLEVRLQNVHAQSVVQNSNQPIAATEASHSLENETTPCSSTARMENEEASRNTEPIVTDPTRTSNSEQHEKSNADPGAARSA